MSHRARFPRRPILATLAVALLAGPAFGLSPAAADVRAVAALASATWRERAGDPAPGPRIEGVRMADADCSAAAADAAAETGGQVLSVSSRDDGGQTVCIVTLLVPGEDGERPRKRTITVSQ